MVKPVADSPTAPFGIRLALIALLPLLALAVYLDGQYYDPDLITLAPRKSGTAPTPDLFPDTIAGLHRAGQLRRFDKDNLYEYINGHAEYFIGAGFHALAVGEYGDVGDGQPALVVNLYDLTAPLNAFGVLVDEAGDREPVDVGSMGFRSGQGLSFIHGPFYVQMRLFDDALSTDAAGADMARSLAEQAEDPGLAFQFPDLGEVTSTRFVKEDYRGLEFLSNVLERGFERNGEAFQAFLIHGSEAEIVALVAAFEAFFEEDEMSYRRIDRNGLELFRVEDPYEGEWFFVPLRGSLVGAYTQLDEELIAAIEKFAGSNR
jgi:hypothetical protein